MKKSHVIFFGMAFVAVVWFLILFHTEPPLWVVVSLLALPWVGWVTTWFKLEDERRVQDVRVDNVCGTCYLFGKCSQDNDPVEYNDMACSMYRLRDAL